MVRVSPFSTDVQRIKESAPWLRTASHRPATLARASVDVRNETAKGDYVGGDCRESSAIWSSSKDGMQRSTGIVPTRERQGPSGLLHQSCPFAGSGGTQNINKT